LRHITARMAWHDRGWDGHICTSPAANTYCTGSHSLLSERLAREKDTEIESAHAGAKLDAALPDYLPPCFWTSSAFASEPTEALHRHPFIRHRDTKQIKQLLPASSAYTWPFRLSITHASYKKNGQYFPDLEQRIARYRARLVPGHSLVFFYLNYDNPVSADDYKYALVGCGRLVEHDLAGSFPFDGKELAKIRADDGMHNFPTLNWALRLTHGGPGASVRLPYQEYLAHIGEHPQDETKLEQIRVLIEEPALIPGFKYVSEQVSNDQALALLYKLRRAFTAVGEHGIVAAGAELQIIDGFIEELWQARGLYPGLGSVLSVLADLSDGEPQLENDTGDRLVDAVRATLAEGEDLLDATFALIASKAATPATLAEHKATLRAARAGLSDHKAFLEALRKLSLFALTPRQVARILFPDSDKVHAFGGQTLRPSEIAANPYLLSEAYVPAIDNDAEQRTDLDREQATDAAIDYLTIDIGMFPDRRYIEPHDQLQDLTVAGPERLRAFAIEALRQNEDQGHTFAPLPSLVEVARAHPLFHKDKIALSETQFLSDDHLAHFAKRMHIEAVDGDYFFYLQETKDAEAIVARYVNARLEMPSLKVDTAWLEAFLDQEADAITKNVKGFDREAFKLERRSLMQGALAGRLYCITGRPGAGKTEALHALLDRLEASGQTAIVLAPTGKAALRLNTAKNKDSVERQWKAETLDRWLFRSGLADYLDGRSLAGMKKAQFYEPADNLVIDEMSMVDLPKFALLLRALEVNQATSLKRLILVGDENQLPPIGCGRPFYDIIGFLREDAAREAKALVRLTTNCRQQGDHVVLDAAHLFAGKNRYHTELYDKMLEGGQISDFLRVGYWEDISELQTQVRGFIDATIQLAPDIAGRSNQEAFNLLLGLYDKGYVPQNNTPALKLDRAQVLTPYRGGPSGGLGLSDYVRTCYRGDELTQKRIKDSAFVHSDKIIRITNYYAWNPAQHARELRLSNGSIGVICKNAAGWRGYFPESDWPIKWEKVDEDDFELAYAITVHKAQGSEFQEVLVVVPERRALLSRELIYTALTRSKTRLCLLVQKTPRANPLQIARERSVLLSRNSSTFSNPIDAKRIYEPEQGVKVKSKIEYLIYQRLQQAREQGALSFAYEHPLDLPFDGRTVTVKPDFTIECSGRTFYWEHLGMLDRADYAGDWAERRAAYEKAGLVDALVTSDDLSGVKDERLQALVAHLINGAPAGDGPSPFSHHHYRL
jgi:exodeoxyribonuclease V alpha subunit